MSLISFFCLILCATLLAACSRSTLRAAGLDYELLYRID